MMKHIIFTGALVLVSAMNGEAIADCATSQVVDTSLQALLAGNTICVSNGSGGWDAQEEHISDGVLKDFKLGPGHAVDPETQIGSWSVSGSGTSSSVTYNYTGASPASYTYQVYSTGSNGYDFCNGSTLVVSGTLKSGTGAGCP